MSEDSPVTIAFVFRERFSDTIACLKHLLDTTIGPYELICVDGGSPEAVAAPLRQLAAEHGFTLIRSENYLSPNESRNLALQQVRTPYVVFVDNDVEVGENWLQPLLACAQETGAWLVAPLYMELLGDETKIHMYGGTVKLDDSQGRPVFHEKHQLNHAFLEEGGKLVRHPTELVEFHTLLMNMDAYRATGPLDAKLLNTAEHLDLCLTVKKAGKPIFIEPASVVTHRLPYGCLQSCDKGFFSLRWSEAWTRATLARLAEKYAMPEDTEGLGNRLYWVRLHRQRTLAVWPLIESLFGTTVHEKFRNHIGMPLERRLNLWRYPVADYTANRECEARIIALPQP